MIYIAGNTFNFNPKFGVAPRTSMQEQMAMSRNIMPAKTNSNFDNRFVSGHTYRIANIKKITEDNKQKVKYVFANISDISCQDIDIVFDDTSRADEYIAAISGKVNELQETRKTILASYESSDF